VDLAAGALGAADGHFSPVVRYPASLMNPMAQQSVHCAARAMLVPSAASYGFPQSRQVTVTLGSASSRCCFLRAVRVSLRLSHGPHGLDRAQQSRHERHGYLVLGPWYRQRHGQQRQHPRRHRRPRSIS